MPYVGFTPTTPLKLAGWRIEPPVSVPSANGTIPNATATAEPPLLPPATLAGSTAFNVGPNAEFSVEDSGIGIPAEHIPRLTERFYRVDRGRSRETGGTGLGLAIAKRALARHDASLEIESKPGKGSRFTARFPARRLAAAGTQRISRKLF